MNDTTTAGEPLSMGAITRFWFPLALTWLMMAAEGPFLAAIIARLNDPKSNLAAWGVAFAVAIIVEAPIIMILSASTAMAKDRLSFSRLRRFTYALNGAITAAMACLIFTPAYGFLFGDLLGLPTDVLDLTHTALIILLPWPAAIGYRRFYQGLLIRSNQTHKVAIGTVIRLATMGTTGTVLYVLGDLPGAAVGAAAASMGVVAEGLASRFMARRATVLLMRTPAGPGEQAPTYLAIARFYWPLALTSTVSLSVHPMITFFVGHGPFAVESLAVLPVINGLSFIFRAVGLSYQEVAIAKMGERGENYQALRNFALILGGFSAGGLALLAFTPLAGLWFEGVSGLTTELANFAYTPTRIIALFPALSVLLSFQRAMLVISRRTSPVSTASFLEVGSIVVLLAAFIDGFQLVGATAAMIALMGGRLLGNAYLARPSIRAVRGLGSIAEIRGSAGSGV